MMAHFKVSKKGGTFWKPHEHLQESSKIIHLYLERPSYIDLIRNINAHIGKMLKRRYYSLKMVA